jgi:hypothetical protein
MPTPSYRSQRVTHLLLIVLALGVWGLLLRPLMPSAAAEAKVRTGAASATFDTLTVQRINVNDVNGKTRFVIANGSRFPDVEVHGKVYPRSINDTAGMVFFDGQGKETGGLGLAKLNGDDIANFTFDYAYQLTDGIRIVKRESPDGARWQAGFEILDRRPVNSSDESSQGIQRIALEDQNHNARLVISDTQGHPRIRIGVDETGTPAIEMLGPDGKSVYRAEPNSH